MKLVMQDHGRDCAALIKHIDTKMTKQANERFDMYGVTFRQVRLLMLLLQKGSEAVPLKFLEKNFEVAQSTASGLVVRLEKKGLVQGYVPADDKRQKVVRLTEKGKELCISIEEDMREGERVLLQSLDEKERMQFYSLLRKVNDSM
ncbi:MAG: MarR family transcriptional regulator [Lachnospiraceae bacterium]|nr:MarR family transcriptional regulator [Lachnospiraceae bacterium]